MKFIEKLKNKKLTECLINNIWLYLFLCIFITIGISSLVYAIDKGALANDLFTNYMPIFLTSLSIIFALLSLCIQYTYSTIYKIIDFLYKIHGHKIKNDILNLARNKLVYGFKVDLIVLILIFFVGVIVKALIKDSAIVQLSGLAQWWIITVFMSLIIYSFSLIFSIFRIHHQYLFFLQKVLKETNKHNF